MSAPSEKDCVLALSVAKLLDVELDEWQERMLKWMLMSHREPAPMSLEEMDAQRALLPDLQLCGAVWDNSDLHSVMRCVLPVGHTSEHYTVDRRRWVVWPG